MFGQIPDILEDVWVDIAVGQVEDAKKIIDSIPKKQPFHLRYHEVEKVDWERCTQVLDDEQRKRYLARGWAEKG